jgi:hypothetical protein
MPRFARSRLRTRARHRGPAHRLDLPRPRMMIFPPLRLTIDRICLHGELEPPLDPVIPAAYTQAHEGAPGSVVQPPS